jgi:hypothetical protein
MSFICLKCDSPIIGDTVAEDYCVRCLMGVDEPAECAMCYGPIELGCEDDEICLSCQETIDIVSDGDEGFDSDDDEEEFLRGPL